MYAGANMGHPSRAIDLGEETKANLWIERPHQKMQLTLSTGAIEDP
jgi:hypothetical protein